MKGLILNGSPRRDGKIGRLMKYAAEVSGEDVEVVNVYDLNIRPCTACMKCRIAGHCVLPEDDGHRLARRITEAEWLVVGSPTHWGNMSAGLKNMFDRLVPVFMGESSLGIPRPRQRGKRAVVVATCTTPFPFNVFFRQSRGTVKMIREVLQTGGFRVYSLEVPGTRKWEVIPGKYLKRLARKVKKAQSR